MLAERQSYHISKTAERLPRSMMRELIGLTHKPGIISFAAGLPASDGLLLDQFRECIDAVLRRDGPKALQYGPPFMPLREWLAEYMQTRGVECSPENIYITNGAQQGLNILAQLFLNPGDTAVIEEVTFTGIRQAMLKQGADIQTIPTDLRTGADIEALEAALNRHPKPRLAVLITDFHNPLGVSLSLEKRRRVAELAARHNIIIVEDDPYSALRIEGEARPSIKSFDVAERVIYSGSFSKMIAPSMRLGWMVVPSPLLPKITVLRETIDIESAALIQRAVYEFLSRGNLAPHLTWLNALNRERRDAMLAALNAHLSDIAHWTVPTGGLFIWVTLPETIDTWAMIAAAINHNVAYVPGTTFAVNGGQLNALRLSYSNVTPGQIDEGIERLSRVIRQQM